MGYKSGTSVQNVSPLSWSTEAFEGYVVHPCMQSHAASMVILFTVVHGLCPCENTLGREEEKG